MLCPYVGTLVIGGYNGNISIVVMLAIITELAEIPEIFFFQGILCYHLVNGDH